MPPKAAPKKKAANGYKLPAPLPKGIIVEDVAKKKWILGTSIGKGGFGEIYSAQEEGSKSKDYPYVIKIEPHGNGPLFVEMHFYIRNAKKEDIERFKTEKGLKLLGMPAYIGSGSHEHNGEKFRFVVMEKFGTDLLKIYLENNKCFPKSTAFKIAVQILDVLEYVHSRGYVHADIKGANILMGATKVTQNKQVYLVDFGLATKMTSEKVFKPNPKKAHDGTIEYLSRDAHKGVPTARGDLEILAYNIIHWLGCTLPWEKDLSDPTVVQKSKEEHMENPQKLIKACFTKQNPPGAVIEFLKYVNSLKFDEEPDYKKIRDLFLKEIDSGDGLGKPFQFTSESKTPQKRKSLQKVDKSPVRKMSKKKATQREEQKEDNNDINGHSPESDNEDVNPVPITNASDRRGKARVNYSESPESGNKKNSKVKKPRSKAVTKHSAEVELGAENAMDGYTAAMKEVLAKKQMKNKTKSKQIKAVAGPSKKKKVPVKEDEGEDSA